MTCEALTLGGVGIPVGDKSSRGCQTLWDSLFCPMIFDARELGWRGVDVDD